MGRKKEEGWSTTAQVEHVKSGKVKMRLCEVG
jgi:hypothetical protein